MPLAVRLFIFFVYCTCCLGGETYCEDEKQKKLRSSDLENKIISVPHSR